eukprot:5922171-Prymnesium_polylepis.1
MKRLKTVLFLRHNPHADMCWVPRFGDLLACSPRYDAKERGQGPRGFPPAPCEGFTAVRTAGCTSPAWWA